MPQKIRTKEAIINGILNDYATQMGVDVSELGDEIRVRSTVLGGALWTMELKLSKVQNNLYPDKAEEDELIRDGSIWLGREPGTGEQGQYECTITGNGGGVIKASTQFKSDSTSTSPDYIFILDSDFIMPGTPGLPTTSTITLRSLTIGLDAQLLAGDTLTSIQPLASFDDSLTVSSVVVTPVAPESIESYRDDVLEVKRLLAQGGSPSDYRKWCSELPSIRTVYPYLQSGGGGNLIIYTEATKENTAVNQVIGVPTQDTLNAVYKWDGVTETGVVIISPELTGRRPVGVKNIISAPIQPIPVDLYFTNLSDNEKSPTIRTAVDDHLYEIRPFVAGADAIGARNDVLSGGGILSAIYEGLLGSGVVFSSVDLTLNGNPFESSERMLWGNIPYLRNIYNNGNLI